MKTKLNLTLLTALFASFALVSCDQDPNELLEGEWPFNEENPSGEYTITFDSESRSQGYVRAFMKIDGEEFGVNRANAGDEIWLRASSYNGFEFLEWIATNVTLSDTETNEVKFTMPASDVLFEAVFDDLSKPKPTPYELEHTTIPAHKALAENVKLRAWKAAQTRQVFGWFDAWSGRKDEGQNSMRGLPKEMSIIANWGGPKWDMPDWQAADMKYVQEVWGAKVVVTLFAEKTGDDVDADPLYSTISSSATDDAVIRPPIAAYAKALYTKCIENNYDGFDWDFEPGYGGNATSCPLWYNKAQAETFIDELSYWFGQEAMTRTNRTANGINRGAAPTKRLLLIVDGAVHESAFKFNYTYNVDYYIQQAYGVNSVSGAQGRVAGIITQLQDHINNSALPNFTLEEAVSRCILAENWENASYAASGGGVFVFAEYKHQSHNTGGFGTYRTGLGYKATTEPYKGSVYYAHLRKAIDLQYGEGPREL